MAPTRVAGVAKVVVNDVTSSVSATTSSTSVVVMPVQTGVEDDTCEN